MECMIRSNRTKHDEQVGSYLGVLNEAVGGWFEAAGGWLRALYAPKNRALWPALKARCQGSGPEGKEGNMSGE